MCLYFQGGTSKEKNTLYVIYQKNPNKPLQTFRKQSNTKIYFYDDYVVDDYDGGDNDNGVGATDDDNDEDILTV